MEKSWDLIIIGGGPAGSTAARYASSTGIKTLVNGPESFTPDGLKR